MGVVASVVVVVVAVAAEDAPVEASEPSADADDAPGDRED